MAKVIIYTTNPGNPAPTNLRTIIQGLGYTVVVVTTISLDRVKQEGKPGAGVAMVFDLSGINSTILAQMSAEGYVCAVTLHRATVYDFKIYYISNIHTSSIPSAKFVNTSNILSSDVMESPTFPINSNVDYLNLNGFMVSVKHLIQDAGSTMTLAFMHNGNATFNGIYVKSPIFFLSFLTSFPNQLVNDQIRNFFRDILQYAILTTEPPYYIQGTVKDLEGNPLERDISIYSQTNYTLKNTGKSSALTGEYSVGAYTNEPVFVVYHPSSTEKPDIHYNLVPVNNPSYIS